MPTHDKSSPVRSGLIATDGSRCGSKPTKNRASNWRSDPRRDEWLRGMGINPVDHDHESALESGEDRPAKNKQRKAYVYCISDGEYYKIGMAVNVSSRLSSLQTGSPNKLTLIDILECNGRQQALARERNLHKQHRQHRVRGEWFRETVLVNLWGKYQQG